MASRWKSYSVSDEVMAACTLRCSPRLSSIALTPLLARAVSRATDVSIGEVARTSVLPSLLPTAAATAAAGAFVLLDVRPLVALVAGGALGVTVWLAVAGRWSITEAERSELRRLIARNRAEPGAETPA